MNVNLPQKTVLFCLCVFDIESFLAPTGALEEGILCVRTCVCRDIIQNSSENEF